MEGCTAITEAWEPADRAVALAQRACDRCLRDPREQATEQVMHRVVELAVALFNRAEAIEHAIRGEGGHR